MSRKYSLIIYVFFFVLTGCRHGYKVENGKVYYEFSNEASGQNERLMADADAKTFQELNIEGDFDFSFGRDKNHLFIDGELIHHIDPNTFSYLGNYIFRDKDAAYFFGSYCNLDDCKINGVNPSDIQLIKYPWSKAKNYLIHGGDTIQLNDINDFIPIDEDWGKTKNYIINNNQIVYGADVASFEIINAFEGKDKNFNYKFGIINEDNFSKVSIKNYNFSNISLYDFKPIVFTDIYDSLVNYDDDKNSPIKSVDYLIHSGFQLKERTYLKWAGESKIIRTILQKDNWIFVVEKLYRYDFGLPPETKNKFKVSERIYRINKMK